jgi:hypothetical protein
MKKFSLVLLLSLFVAGLSLQLNAQVKTPAPSPFCKVEQKVGLTDVTVEYSRPGVKDRVIFGNLVPYGKPWRTGANQATKITFSTAVTIGGTELEAGSYALLTTPGETEWTFNLYPHESGNWGSYREKDPAVSVKANPGSMEFSVETMIIDVGNLKNSSATITVVWDKSAAGFAFEVPTDEAVMSSIEATMDGPRAGDYSAAANYYYAEDKDLNKALKWMNKALDKGGERFWLLRTKSLIQAKLGDKGGAIKTAKRSLELATEAGNEDYIKMNNESIKEWMM